MRIHYVSNSKNKINIPFTPPLLEAMDKFILITKIFGEDLTEDDLPLYQIVYNAIADNDSEKWELAGRALLDKDYPKYENWAQHCFKLSRLVDNRGHKKVKKIFDIEVIKEETPIERFKRLMKG